MNVVRLALAYVRRRPLTTAFNVALLAIGVATITLVILLSRELEQRLVREASGIVGNQCIVVAIDAKRKGAGWEVYTHGGRNATGLDAVDWARVDAFKPYGGIRIEDDVVCTDGAPLNLTREAFAG